MTAPPQENKAPEPPGTKSAVLPVGLVFLAVFVLGYAIPDYWWGTHFIRFLSPIQLAVFALACLYFFFLFRPLNRRILPRVTHKRAVVMSLIGVCALACASTYYALPVQTDMDIYGDARRNLELVEKASNSFKGYWIEQLFSPNVLNRETGEWLTLNLVRFVSYAWGVSPTTAFGVVNAALGFVFVLVWVSFVHARIDKPGLKIIMILSGVWAGVTHLFTHHAEVYAAAVVLLLLFLITAIGAVSMRRRRWIAVLLLLAVLAAKAHFGNNVVWVPFLVTVVYVLFGDRPQVKRFFSRRRILPTVLLPIVLGFVVYYGFVLQNYNVSRQVEFGQRHAKMFLSLIHAESPGVPRYTLFSPAHIFDFGNVVLQWSVPAIFLTVVIWIAYGRRKLLNAPEIVIVELTLILYAGVYFVMNPVLSMPRDWDLFMIPAPVLLVYAVLLLSRVQNDTGFSRRLVGPAAALVVLGLAPFVVNSQSTLLWRRLESVGVHSYRTYYFGSSYILNVAANMDVDRYERRERYADIIERIKPYAQGGVDNEYAILLANTAREYWVADDLPAARLYLEEAVGLHSSNDNYAYSLGELLWRLNEFEEALRYVTPLANANPQNADYQTLAFKITYRLGRFAEAVVYGDRYLHLRPDDENARQLVDDARSRLVE